ncbi:MAG: RloB family protein [Candidatus Tenebribacter davisii]|nr:RloB family protein [Candidatus Tenebribacter davisii]
MGSDDLFRKRKAEDLERKIGQEKEYLNSILIVCEGEKTEPNYFKSFQVSGVKVEVRGTGNSNITLVNDALEIWKEYAKDDKYFEVIWCVFDRDSFSQQNYNQAFTMIENEQNKLNREYGKKVNRDIKLKIAYSNQAFELWYLLHYDYHVNGINRSRYKEILTKKMGHKYKKNDAGMYDFLQRLTEETNGRKGQDFAINNARKLRALHGAANCHNYNPSTSVDLLVEELNQHLKK